MADIDLIPNDYRTWLRQRAMLRQFATVLGTLAVLAIGASALFSNSARHANALAAELRTRNAVTEQQQQQLQALEGQRAEYERQWSLLRGLRAGAAVEDIFAIVDNALVEGDLWFLDWSFRRAGVTVDGQQRGVETGYFIIVGAKESASAQHKFEVETHMSIHGQAKDHQALSAFVRALFGEPLIRDVSVQKTVRIGFGNGRAVDFDITVVLNSAPTES